MNVSKLLVIIDSEKNNEILIERTKRIAIAYGASVELYVAAYSTALEGSYWFDHEGLLKAHQGYIHGKKEWLSKIVDQLKEEGLDVSGQVEWEKPLYQAVLNRAKVIGSDLILKQPDHHSMIAKALFTNTDWHLIRESLVPLLFVHNIPWGSHLSIAAAVDPLHVHSKPEGLDDDILQLAHQLACKLPGELHVVHAYEPVPTGVIVEFDSIVGDYEVYREKIRQRHSEGLDTLLKRNVEPSTIVHFEEGIPERVLPQVVTEADIDIMVMGAVSRHGLDKIFVGGTAERVLDNLKCDVLVLK